MLIPSLNTGNLAKLTIIPFIDADCKEPAPLGVFIAPINPEELSISHQHVIDKKVPVGKTSTKSLHINVKPQTISFKFYLDGTGVTGITGDKLAVSTQLELFSLVCGFNGVIHSPNYLKISWGTFLFTGKLESYTVNYKLFTSTGLPMRAVIDATFTAAVSDLIQDAINNLLSPDLTHVRIARAGDTLLSMTQNVYGDFKYYLEVAKANNLKNFRKLNVGDSLFFPPFDKNNKN